jgi:predicted transcriptional regulator of viral defense system
MTLDTQAARILRIAERRGVVRSHDVTEAGLARATLMRLVRDGQLVQLARGVYALPGQRLSRQHSLAEVAARSSRGVFCLLTALHFHGLIRRPPDAVWLAIPNKGRVPTGGEVPLEVVRFSGAALAEGVEHHLVDGVGIRVYGPGKTVADCFKFRDRIGMETAAAALRTVLRRRLATRAELEHYAGVCRARETMLPLLASGTAQARQ